jgi:3',5'-cyclic AMP phosphodiesterase CpdA
MRKTAFRHAALLFYLLVPVWACAEGFYIPPHLQNVTTDGATLIWETQDESVGVVEYGPKGQYTQQAGEAFTAKLHRVRVTGLSPDTAYSYRVRAGAEERGDAFKTAPAEQRPIVFAVLGDSRRWEERWQEHGITEHMMQWGPEFVVNTGDLVLDGQKHDLWTEHFGRFAGFNSKLMMAAARGNHEGPRTGEPDTDWFARYHELPGKGEPFSVFDWGNSHFVLISMDYVSRCAEELERDLAANTRKNSFVVFHSPVYCTGYSGPEDSRKEDGQSSEKIRAILDKYNVPVHLAGHTHIYERSWPIRENRRDDARGTTYIVQGGDINANYPDWWSAVTDNRETQSKPTYTVFFCQDDRIEHRTFAVDTAANGFIEVDHQIIWRDESVPKAALAALEGAQGADLAKAIEELGAMVYTPAGQKLAGCLSHPEPDVKRAAATAVRRTGSPDAADACMHGLEDGDPEVVRELARALEVMLPERLAEDAVRKINNAQLDTRARVSLVGALQFHAAPDLCRKVFIALLEEENTPGEVRNRAAYALASVAGKDDVRVLAGLFEKETEPYVTVRLAVALNKITGKSNRIDGKGPLAKSSPGQRGDFVKKWLEE